MFHVWGGGEGIAFKGAGNKGFIPPPPPSRPDNLTSPGHFTAFIQDTIQFVILYRNIFKAGNFKGGSSPTTNYKIYTKIGQNIFIATQIVFFDYWSFL